MRSKKEEILPTGLVYTEEDHLLTLLQQSQYQSKILMEQAARQSSYGKITVVFVFVLVGFIIAGGSFFLDKLTQFSDNSFNTANLKATQYQELSEKYGDLQQYLEKSREEERTMHMQEIKASRDLIKTIAQKDFESLKAEHEKELKTGRDRIAELENKIAGMNEELARLKIDLIQEKKHVEEIKKQKQEQQELIAARDRKIRKLELMLTRRLTPEEIRLLEEDLKDDE